MPTKKLALFVEGQTEFIFLREFLLIIAGSLQLRIEGHGIRGGVIFRTFARGVPKEDAIFQVTLFDCKGDGTVATAIKDRYGVLVADGFTTVLGLRDLYGDGRTYDQHKEFERKLNATLPKGPVDAKIILAVMEVEAWFLKELNHFAKFNPALTPKFIREKVKVDLVSVNVETIRHPAAIVHKIFDLVGGQYDKHEHEIEAIVSRLDFDKMYLEDQESVPALNELLSEIDYFLFAQ